MTVDLTAAGSSLDHQALFYADPDEYLMVIDAFVRAAAASGSAVLVAVPGKKLVRLQEALAELGDAVRFTDLAVAGRNPGRILPDVLAFADAQRGRRVAIVGEPVWPGRSDLELAVCAQHEALVNAAFAGRDATILCPYDAGVLQEAQLRDARHAHPVLITGGVRRPSPFYTDAVTAAAAFNRPLPVIPAWAAVLTFATVAELSAVRGFV
ncbi:MEDS domain-containing protein, partial [Actinoplanes octamycinicus]